MTDDELLGAAVRHQLHVLRYGNGLASRVIKLLNSTDRLIIERVAAGLTAYSDARLLRLLEELRFINDTVYRQAFEVIEGELTELASTMAEAEIGAIRTATGLTTLALPSPTRLAVIAASTPLEGHLLASWRNSHVEQQSRSHRGFIRTGMNAGDTIDQIVKQIRGPKGLEISRQSAKSLVLTASAAVNNEARAQAFEANPNVIKGVKVVATHDLRTTPICQSRDGNFYPLGKPYPKPPYHVRCRTTLSPVTKSFKELGIEREEIEPGKRASMDGAVPSDTTYGTWLKRQSITRQDDVLGKERGKLYRDGKVKFDDLYRADGTYRSLSELRRRLK